MKTSLVVSIVLFSTSLSFNAKSQIGITNVAEIATVKKGTTYVAMKDPTSEKAKAYIEAIKSTWTISKLEFIKYSELSKYVSAENSFLTIDGYNRSSQYSSEEKLGQNKLYASTCVYLSLWTCDPKFFEEDKSKKKKKKEFYDMKQNEVARIDLYTDFVTIVEPDNIYYSDYDCDNHIRNWSPGILKNYIKTLMTYLNKAEEKSLYKSITNEKELKNLKKEMLYVPNYVLIKHVKMTGDESKKHDEKEIFEDYKLKYKLLSTDELSDKILTETTPFYYMVYVKSNTEKYVSIINSVTGEMIYSRYTPMSHNIKSDDLKDLYKAIQGQ